MIPMPRGTGLRAALSCPAVRGLEDEAGSGRVGGDGGHPECDGGEPGDSASVDVVTPPGLSPEEESAAARTEVHVVWYVFVEEDAIGHDVTWGVPLAIHRL